MITGSSFVRENLPCHKSDAHKGDRGKVLIIGGSTGFTGAICMAAEAAMRCGAGLITVGIPKSLNSIFEIKLTEAMTLPLDDSGGAFDVKAVQKAFDFGLKCDAVAIGPGAGVNSGTKAIVNEFVLNYDKKLILDADALNILAEDVSVLKMSEADILITPHVGEMSRLTGISTDKIRENRSQISVDFANEFGVNVLLKGKNTVITNGTDVFVNPTGNNGMAKGGSGDVLTGICTALSAQGADVFKSGIMGAYIHGMAGDMAKAELTDYAMTPSDTIKYLPQVFKNFI